MTDEKTNLPDPMKTFQERVLNKVRTDIADMLPEEAIKSMFDQAIQSIFFKEIPPKTDSYGRISTPAQPSWFVQEVTRQAEPLLKAHIAERMKEFEPQIQQAVKDFIKTESIAIIIGGTMSQVAHRQAFQDLDQLAGNIARHIKQGF